MTAVYLAATILGGALLAASLVSGHHGAHEVDHGDGHGIGHGAAALEALLSIRFWTYLCAFGGIAGLLLHRVAHLGEPLAFLLSLGTGLASGVGAQVVIGKASAGSGGVVEPRQLVYRLGTLLLPASPGVKSRVRLTINDQIFDLTAVTEDSQIAAREEVLVLDIKDGVAVVTRNKPTGEKP